MATYNFNSSWRFQEGAAEQVEELGFDDSAWRVVDLPHDWSVEHGFSPDVPAFCRGAWLPAGVGSYRKRFRLPAGRADEQVSVLFDGVQRNATVFLNGHQVGFRPWGYIAFECDLTPFVDRQGENVLVVKVDNSRQPGTRWYAGSGIYRDVELHVRDAVHIPTWGVQVETAAVSEASATLLVKTELRNAAPRRTDFTLVSTILDADGGELARQEKTHVVGTGLLVRVEDKFELANPKLWGLGSPRLHTLRQELRRDGRSLGSVDTRFGVRSMKCDADTGFWLNGENLKLKGVCLHNDGGALGAACSKRTFERQLRTLKEMGCNAVRTAHHPFAASFLDACDELGMLVLAEAFDEWQAPISVMPFSDGEPQRLGVQYYAELFDQWSERDLADMVRRDRNHPAIFMWSVGNEIPQMRKASGQAIAERLRETIHNLDSRPVTCAVVAGEIPDANLKALDVPGYNYPSAEFLDTQRRKFPNVPSIVTEHYSAQPSVARGEYFPKGVEPKLPYRHPDAANFVRAHTLERGAKAWEDVAARPSVMGSFIWTGWDYLGETTPYDWPAHTSFFGVVDIVGLPKDGYHYYRSRWRGEPLVQLRTHWNWPDGTMVAVKATSNCALVELFLNGRSLGVRAAKDGLDWNVPFAPGELKAVADGGLAACVVRTAGEPRQLRLSAFPASIMAGGGDMAYIRCELLDAAGTPATQADTIVNFEVEGPAILRALDNGDPFDITPFQGGRGRKAFHGGCVAMVAAGKEPGNILVKARAEGLPPATVAIASRLDIAAPLQL